MYLVDSNVFFNVILYADEFSDAKKFLNENSGNIATTLVNLMEIFSILTRKYRWKKEDALKIVENLQENCMILIPNEYDFIYAYELQKRYLLTTNDALILSIAQKENFTLITMDKELLKFDGEVGDVKRVKRENVDI